MRYQVFVAEDEHIVREGIRNCLENTEQFTLCGEAPDGEMALPAILELRPDILITDIKMPFMDGLALARAVRRALPWMKILIISGYDEFDFAKQAISIGVEEYLLKPFHTKALLEILHAIAAQLEEERQQILHADFSRSNERKEQLILRDAFIDSLLTGASSPAADAIEQAAKFGIDLPARHYLAAAAELLFSQAEPNAAAQVHDVMENALQERGDVFWCLRGSDRMALVAKGESAAQLDNAIYEIIHIAKGHLERKLGIELRAAIGSVKDRIGEMHASYHDAYQTLRNMPGLPVGSIVNFNDLQQQIPASMPIGTPIAQRLRYATRQDADAILAQFRENCPDFQRNSILYSYYWIMDLLLAAARVINELGGNAQLVFPELDDAGAMLRAAASDEELETIARDILERFIAFRETSKTDRYGDVIAQAKEYIHAHYGQSNLSLNTVAAHCGFSPNHFSSTFSLQTGETFISFLTRVRMEQAKRLLLETDLRTLDVAAKVGYHDANYFRFLFKKYAGVSPRELRAES